MIPQQERDALRAEAERLTAQHEAALTCAIKVMGNGPCEKHSGANTPPLSEFIERISGHCLLCEIDKNKQLIHQHDEMAAQIVEADMRGMKYKEECERLEHELAACRASDAFVDSLRADKLMLADEVKRLEHELAVRERQAEILAGEGWSNGKTSDPFKSERLSNALAQARSELAKEAEAKPEATP